MMSQNPIFWCIYQFPSPRKWRWYRSGRELRSENRVCFLSRNCLLYPRVLFLLFLWHSWSHIGALGHLHISKIAIGPPPHSIAPYLGRVMEIFWWFRKFLSSCPKVRNISFLAPIPKALCSFQSKKLLLRPLLKLLPSYATLPKK